MKKACTLFFLLTSFFFTLSAQIYVDDTAMGDNTGANWEHAYIDLQDALAAAGPNDEIWVAQGTYRPDTADGSLASTFLIDQDIQLLGGFSGNGDERDPEQFETILSGDLNGDDIAGNFFTNREDNVWTVVRITSAVTNAALVDGFTIRNGRAGGSGTNESPARSGGGLFCQGNPQIAHCHFLENYAVGDGGAMFVTGASAEGLTLAHCYFEYNSTSSAETSDGGGMSIHGVPGEGVIIQNTAFVENTGGWGGGIHFLNSSGFMDTVWIKGNNTIRQGGGIRFYTLEASPDLSLTLRNSLVEENIGAFGGGIYAIPIGPGPSIKIENTTFRGNQSAPFLSGWGSGGAGLGMFLGTTALNATVEVKECVFQNNTTEGTGAGFRFGLRGDGCDLLVQDCQFFGNQSQANGGGMYMFLAGDSQDGVVLMDDCHFEDNYSLYNGSAFYSEIQADNLDFTLKNSAFIQNTTEMFSATVEFYGGGFAYGDVKVDSCLFSQNSATYGGGVFAGNGGYAFSALDFHITHSEFTENEATEGGAMLFYNDSGSNTDIFVEDCLIEGNTASQRGGGILFAPSTNSLRATIDRCSLLNNSSPKGGAINSYLYDAEDAFLDFFDVQIHNSLIARNVSATAAIHLDSVGPLTLLNTTLAHNESNGIQLADNSIVKLKNSILYNPGYSEIVRETPDVTVYSFGGNVVWDNSLGGDWTHSHDQVETDPLFLSNTDYHLQDDSPAIDRGMPFEEIGAMDLDGNTRVVNCVDIGAYESNHDTMGECLTVSSREAVQMELLLLSPNPATDWLQIQTGEPTTEAVRLDLYDAQGQLLRQMQLTPDQQMDVHDLPPGMYFLQGRLDDTFYNGRFIKE